MYSSIQARLYKLCKSSSGYCLKFLVYTAQDTKSSATGSMMRSEAFVTDLLGDRLANGHTIFMDKWYSSPHLFLAVKNAELNAVAMVRTNRKNMKGECNTLFSHGIIAIQWKD